MKYIEIFDFLRHALEFFFFLITGPLVTAAAVKKMKQRKETKNKILELEEKIKYLEEQNRKSLSDGVKPE